MSGLMDKAKDAVNQHLDKTSQPGNSVERKADDGANQQIDQATDQAGLGDQYDNTIDKVADTKVNQDIPFGNK